MTDIRPRDHYHSNDWTDSEAKTVTKDGIELPGRGNINQCDLLAPSKNRKESATENGEVATLTTVCGLCLSKPSCYTCPRCNVPYCSLVCYRSVNHSACSEEFYKESVMQELKEMNETDSEGRRKMQDILLKLRQTPDVAEGGIGVLKKMEEAAGEDEEERNMAQALELLSRLAEIQASGHGSSEEINDILANLEEIGGEPGQEEQGVDRNMDDGVEDGDLVDRLSGLDIETMSEESLWEHLTSQERDQFMSLVKGGTVGELVPLWKPWWEEHEEGGEALVALIEEDASKLEGDTLSVEGRSCTGESENTEQKRKALKESKSGPESQTVGNRDNKVKWADEEAERGGNLVTKQDKTMKSSKGKKDIIKVQKPKSTTSVPPVNFNIPPLSSLSSNPSPMVCYGVVNVLFGYAFSMRLFNGDLEPDVIQEFCQTVLAVSESLNSGKVFSSIQEALEGGEAAIFAARYFDHEDPGAPVRAVESVAHIMTGRSSHDTLGYCLAALSQLRLILSEARGALPKGGEDRGTRKKYFLAMKKCEFFQAWVSDNVQQVQRLVAGLWIEHKKRENRRNALEQEKRGVELSWKKGKGRGKSVLIEEIC